MFAYLLQQQLKYTLTIVTQFNLYFLILNKAQQIIKNFSTKYIGIQPDVPTYIREKLTAKGSKLFKEARDVRKHLNFLFLLPWHRQST